MTEASPVPQVQAVLPRLSGGPAERIAAAVRGAHKVDGFIASSEAALIAVTDALASEIGEIAVKSAERRGATVVDIMDVHVADDQVRGNKAALRQAVWLCVAGLLIGFCLPMIWMMVVTDAARYERGVWIGTGLTLVGGATLLFKQFPRK